MLKSLPRLGAVRLPCKMSTDIRGFWEKAVKRGHGVHVLDVADVLEAAQVLTRSFSGTTDTPSEGGLDWVLGRHVGLEDPRRAEILQWWSRGRCSDAMQHKGGVMLGARVGKGDRAPIVGVAIIHEVEEIQQELQTHQIPYIPSLSERCGAGHLLESSTDGDPTCTCGVCGDSSPHCGRMLSCSICEEIICLGCYIAAAGKEVQAMQRRLEVLVQEWHRAYTRHVHGRHLHVTVLGVEPLHQRRGVASTLLRAINAIADASGIPIYLETQGWRNVNMFRRYGFNVVEQATVVVRVSHLGAPPLRRVPPRQRSRWLERNRRRPIDSSATVGSEAAALLRPRARASRRRSAASGAMMKAGTRSREMPPPKAPPSKAARKRKLPETAAKNTKAPNATTAKTPSAATPTDGNDSLSELFGLLRRPGQVACCSGDSGADTVLCETE